MKKLILCGVAVIIIFLTFAFALPCTVYADEQDSSVVDEYGEIVDKINDSLKSADSEAAGSLENHGISADNAEAISDISAADVLKEILSTFLETLKTPLSMLGKIMAVAVLCSLAKSMQPDGAELSGLFEVICILCSVTAIYDGIYSGFEVIKSGLERMNEFMIAYIPIFSSVSAATGSTVSSGNYYASTLLVCEIIALIANKILLPFLSTVLALSLVSAINPELSFCGVADSIKKCVQWILGALMTIFTGLLTVQSITGSSADSLAAKGVKFAASSFIPIVGGAVSDAYSTVYGSLGVIRSVTGTIGIIFICVIVLKPILTLLAIKLVITVGRIINELLGQRQMAGFLFNVNSVLSMGLSVLIVFSIIFIISTAVLMMAAMNTV